MEKGQIFSLDFLISLVAVVLAIGLIIQFSELNVYNKKDNQLFDETKRVAETAGNLLVGNPSIVCKLIDATSRPISNLSNCIDTSKSISKSTLGIPTEFSCSVSEITVRGCASTMPSATKRSTANYFSVSRTVIVSSGDVSKDVFEKCVKWGDCPFHKTDVTITIWK